MRVITLWQPWAQWIMWDWKKIETRTHNKFNNLKGETIAIHAALAYDFQAIDLAYNYLTLKQMDIHERMERENRYPKGVIIGTAHVLGAGLLADCNSQQALIDCGSTKRYGLFLTDVKEFVSPIRISGQQGIWSSNVPADQAIRKPWERFNIS